MGASFSQNKIHGSIAEAACEENFRLMGYTVERTGIEHVAPVLAERIGSTRLHGTYGENMSSHLRTLPDFIVSRVKGSCVEAMFVDAKFRYCHSGEQLKSVQADLSKQIPMYKKAHGETLIYLVTNLIHSDSKSDVDNSSLVWLLFSGSPQNWVPIREADDFSVYKRDDSCSLASIYVKEIHPALLGIFGQI